MEPDLVDVEVDRRVDVAYLDADDFEAVVPGSAASESDLTARWQARGR